MGSGVYPDYVDAGYDSDATSVSHPYLYGKREKKVLSLAVHNRGTAHSFSVQLYTVAIDKFHLGNHHHPQCFAPLVPSPRLSRPSALAQRLRQAIRHRPPPSPRRRLQLRPRHPTRATTDLIQPTNATALNRLRR